MFFFVNGAPPPTWAASAGPENHNSEVSRDTTIMLAQEEMGNISASKARYVTRTASIEIETSAAPAVCVRRVLQYSSRGSTPLIIIYGF